VKLYYTDHFELPLPQGHRFPMSKYRRLRDRLERDHSGLAQGLEIPPAATFKQLSLAHDPEYVQRVIEGTLSPAAMKRIGFPWSPGMVERSRRSSGATLAAARHALLNGIAVNLAGGTHHAQRDAGEGFCVFNDAAVTLLTLRSEGLLHRGVVIDCDVHQGNGTAQILARYPELFTFSIHGEKNFPSRKFPSDWDVPLPDEIDDAGYLMALRGGLDQVFARGPFDLAIYLAGADPFEGDRLGRLRVTKSGLAERDELVLTELRTRGVPVAIAMAGGYAPDVEDIVDIHLQTILAAARLAGS
jgi:acetoin utilization deacetylase AcuC-like enzyme